MALTWSNMKTKAQRLAKTNNAAVLTQLEEDMNTGYHLFNAKLSRYYTRKQQFADLVAGQQLYQTPIDSIRVMGVTVTVSNNYEPVVKQVRSEFQWRNITSVPTNSNWPSYYYVLGNDIISFWPIPSQDVTNGIRFYYQPQDVDLSVDDVTNISTGFTVTVTNGSTTVTASGSAFNSGMAGLWFQVNGETNNMWYEIVSATSTTLTLKSAYVSTSGAGKAWTVGQLSIIPQEYSDAPIHYALSLYFSANGNEVRGLQHKAMFDAAIDDCMEEYSSSNQSTVITHDDAYLNPWLIPPQPGPVHD